MERGVELVAGQARIRPIRMSVVKTLAAIPDHQDQVGLSVLYSR